MVEAKAKARGRNRRVNPTVRKKAHKIRRRTAASCALVHEVELLYGGIESFTY